MRALGIATRVADKTATISVVVLDSGPSTVFDLALVSVQEQFEVMVDEGERALQLGELAARIEGRVRSIAPDRIVVRRADVPARAANTEGPRFRLLLEGAVTSAAQRVVSDTIIRNGKSCAAAYAKNTTKDDLDHLAESIVRLKKHAEAAAAALSALAHP
jgi:hypothetical protein